MSAAQTQDYLHNTLMALAQRSDEHSAALAAHSAVIYGPAYPRSWHNHGIAWSNDLFPVFAGGYSYTH